MVTWVINCLNTKASITEVCLLLIFVILSNPNQHCDRYTSCLFFINLQCLRTYTLASLPSLCLLAKEMGSKVSTCNFKPFLLISKFLFFCSFRFFPSYWFFPSRISIYINFCIQNMYRKQNNLRQQHHKKSMEDTMHSFYFRVK